MKSKRREAIIGYLFCSPAILLLLFSIVLPFLVALGITFTDQRLLSPEPTRSVGLDNYARSLAIKVIAIPNGEQSQHKRLRNKLRDSSLRGYQSMSTLSVLGTEYALVAQDPLFYKSLLNTFYFVVLVIPLQCGTALGLALLINKNLKGRNFFRTLFFAPVVTSMVVVAIVWSFLYNTNGGLINQALGSIFGEGASNIDWLGDEALAMPSIVIMSAWQGAGFQMLIFLAGLQSIDNQLIEAAKLDGANAWGRFKNVVLPGLRNTLVFVAITTTIAAFGLFTQVDVMTGGGPNDSTSTIIFHAIQSGYREQDVAYGATIAVLFFILVMGVSLLQRRLVREKA